MIRPVNTTKQSGLAVIELAMILPILLMLLLATAEFGRAYNHYNTLTKAVRDGSRFVSSEALNNAGVLELNSGLISTARNLILTGHPSGTSQPVLDGLSADDIVISAVDAKHISITASYTYNPIFALGIPLFNQGNTRLNNLMTLQASTVVRAL